MSQNNKLKHLILQSYKNNLKIKLEIGSQLQNYIPEDASDCDILRHLNSIAVNLQKEHIYVSLKDLYDTYKVSQKANGKTLVSWSEAKRQYLIPPQGDCPEVALYWQDALSNVESGWVFAEEDLNTLIEKANSIPDDIKAQIRGYNTARKRFITKIAHTADWHFSDDSTLDETIQAAKFFTRTVIDNDCDLVVIAGDILDRRLSHDSIALNAITDILYTISQCCPIYILCGTKNHDGLTLRILEKIKTKFPIYTTSIPNVTVFCQTFQPINSTVNPDTNSLLIFGIPPVSPQEYTDICENILPDWKKIRERHSKIPAILVGHISLPDALSYDSVVFSKETLQQTGCNLYLLGHIHNAKNIDNLFFYSGSLISRNFSEKAEKGFWIHEIFPEIKSQWIPNPKAKKVVEIEVDNLDSLSQISQTIPENAKVKVHIKQTNNINDIKDALTSAGASEIKIEKEVTPVYVTRIKGFSSIQNTKEKLNKVFDLMKIVPGETILEKTDILDDPEFETKIENTYNDILKEVLDDSN